MFKTQLRCSLAKKKKKPKKKQNKTKKPRRDEDNAGKATPIQIQISTLKH